MSEFEAIASVIGNVVKPLAESRAKSSEYEAQASVAAANARAAQYNADIAMSNAAQEADAESVRQEQLRKQLRRELAANISTRAASGVTLDGSVSDVYADQAAEGSLGLALSRYESMTKQRAYRQQAGGLDYQSQVLNLEASNYRKASRRSLLEGFAGAGAAFNKQLPDVRKILTPRQSKSTYGSDGRISGTNPYSGKLIKGPGGLLGGGV